MTALPHKRRLVPPAERALETLHALEDRARKAEERAAASARRSANDARLAEKAAREVDAARRRAQIAQAGAAHYRARRDAFKAMGRSN